MAGEDLNVSGLAGRYAMALFELADERKALDQVADDLRGLKDAIADSDDFRDFLRSPLYGRDEQMKALGALLEKAGVAELTKNFSLVVAKNRRLFAFAGMIDAYLAILAARRGEVTARVTVARPLSEAENGRLEETLNKVVGGKVKIETKIDESLIGGLIVQVGSRMIDSSIKTKLQRLQSAMKGA